MIEAQKCSEMVSGEGKWGWVHPHQCSRNATVEREGKHFCKIHDPVARKERDEKRYQEYRQKSDYRCSIEARKNQLFQACEGLQMEEVKQAISAYKATKLQ